MGDALNYVKVIIPISETRERHVKVTHEGVFQEIIENGEVVSDLAIEHEEMLPSEDS